MEKRYLIGLRFIRDWLAQFKQVNESANEEDEEEGVERAIVDIDPSSGPLMLESFTSLVKTIFEAHMRQDASIEI